MKLTPYQGYNIHLSIKRYANGRPCIELFDEDDGFPFARATANVTEWQPGEDEILIKNYSENEGLLDWLVSNGIVEDTLRTHRSGFIFLNICKLLVK